MTQNVRQNGRVQASARLNTSGISLTPGTVTGPTWMRPFSMRIAGSGVSLPASSPIRRRGSAAAAAERPPSTAPDAAAQAPAHEGREEVAEAGRRDLEPALGRRRSSRPSSPLASSRRAPFAVASEVMPMRPPASRQRSISLRDGRNPARACVTLIGDRRRSAPGRREAGRAAAPRRRRPSRQGRLRRRRRDRAAHAPRRCGPSSIASPVGRPVTRSFGAVATSETRSKPVRAPMDAAAQGVPAALGRDAAARGAERPVELEDGVARLVDLRHRAQAPGGKRAFRRLDGERAQDTSMRNGKPAIARSGQVPAPTGGGLVRDESVERVAGAGPDHEPRRRQAPRRGAPAARAARTARTGFGAAPSRRSSMSPADPHCVAAS